MAKNPHEHTRPDGKVFRACSPGCALAYLHDHALGVFDPPYRVTVQDGRFTAPKQVWMSGCHASVAFDFCVYCNSPIDNRWVIRGGRRLRRVPPTPFIPPESDSYRKEVL